MPTSDGGYLSVGNTASYSDGINDIWVVRTDSNGNIGASCSVIGTPTLPSANSTATVNNTAMSAIASALAPIPTNAVANNTSAQSNTQCISTDTYSISGIVVDGSNSPISGVTISAGGTISSTTDNNGNYILGGLAAGTYNLTPSKTGYTFSPLTLQVDVPPDRTGKDFVGTSIGVIEYFALGDSIASGHGLAHDGPECYRSTQAYPSLVVAHLQGRYSLVNPHFLACSGATALKPSDKVLKTEKYKWLHNQVSDTLKELRHVPSNHSVLVSITIGANDFDWSDFKKAFFRALVLPRKQFKDWLQSRSHEVANEVKLQISRILLARRNSRVVITEVYNAFNPDSNFFKINPFGDKVCSDLFKTQSCYNRIELGVDTLNNAYKSDVVGALKSKRVTITQGVRDAFRGHWAPRDSCGGQAPDVSDTYIQYLGDPHSNSALPDRVLNALILRGLPALKPGDCFHPNAAGAALYADAVNNAAVSLGR